MAGQRPNIVFILADDMGYGDIGAFGNPDVQTPVLDSLAADGMVLSQHYAGSPVCAPSRAALVTGRYPHRTGAIDTLEGRGLDRLALREVTIAQVLESAGYATGIIGKWHLGALDPRYHPNARGFREFCGFRGGWSDYWKWRLDYNGSIRQADGRYLTDVFTDEAVAFLERHRTEPFFLHLTYNAPHLPLQVPEEEIEPFRQLGKFREAVCCIYGMNRRMDTGVGRVLEALDRLGLAENTIVVFTSDNGPQFGGKGEVRTDRFNCHFNGHKELVYEGGIRVPCIVRWPAGLPGGGDACGEFVHFTDWFPTLLEAAGVAIPADLRLDGRSVLAVLRGDSQGEQARRFWQWNRYTPVPHCNAAMRDGPWKLLWPMMAEARRVSREDADVDRRLKYQPETVTDITRGPEPERHLPEPPLPMLFNLDEDPYEQNNLAEKHPERVEAMMREYDAWFQEVEAERRSITDPDHPASWSNK